MKKFLSLSILFVLFTLSSSAQILQGDTNGDGKLTIEDVTNLVNAILGKKDIVYINLDGSITSYSPISISLEYPKATASGGNITPTFTATQTKTIRYPNGEVKESDCILTPSFSIPETTGASINSSTGVVTWDEYTDTSVDRSVEVTVSITPEGGGTAVTKKATCTQSKATKTLYYYIGQGDFNDEEFAALSVEEMLPGDSKSEWVSSIERYSITELTNQTVVSDWVYYIMIPSEYIEMVNFQYTSSGLTTTIESTSPLLNAPHDPVEIDGENYNVYGYFVQPSNLTYTLTLKNK